MKEMQKDLLKVKIADTRREMGEIAARDIHARILELQSEREQINIIFAAAPSQNETLEALAAYDDIDWSRINAFHMDEYVGLPKDAPQRFSIYLTEHIFKLKPFRTINYIDPSNDGEGECARYTELLKKYPVDIVILGIGENGHIAFNDPHVADFNDARVVKLVELDEVCRKQQVNDGCFADISEVPTHALTLTVPTLFAASSLFCSVPAPTKAWAVRETLTAEISERCPATVMRRHKDASLYCDSDSASLL